MTCSGCATRSPHCPYLRTAPIPHNPFLVRIRVCVNHSAAAGHRAPASLLWLLCTLQLPYEQHPPPALPRFQTTPSPAQRASSQQTLASCTLLPLQGVASASPRSSGNIGGTRVCNLTKKQLIQDRTSAHPQNNQPRPQLCSNSLIKQRASACSAAYPAEGSPAS